MIQPSNQERVSPPWLLIVGLLLGATLLILMVWDSIAPAFNRKNPTEGSAHVIELTNDNWQKEVVESTIPVVVDFTAQWCGPCRILAPTIEKLAERYQGKVKVGKFDVGDKSFHKATKLSAKYDLGSGIPRVLIFKGGDQPRYEFKGAGVSEAEFATAIDRLLH